MKKILLFALAGVLALGTVASCKKETTFYTVTFNSEGGSAVASQRVEDGYHAVHPNDPARDGYSFVEWSKSSTGGTAWNFSTDVVTGNITLYAQWSAVNSAKSDLEKAINAAQNLNKGNYTAASWADLETALAAAKAVDANQNATAQDIADALDNLNNAIDDLDFNPNAGGNNGTSGSGGSGSTGGGGAPTAADKGALETAIANAQSKVQANYTATSWANMQTALTNAKSIDANTNASQAQVNAAASNLRLATAQLVSNSSADPGSGNPGGADKSALKSAMDSANALVEANYTADSWAVLKTDLANAQTVYDNANASQQQVNTALATLQTGVNNLKRSTANDGLVSSLLNQLISLVNSLPSVSAIQNNPLLVAATIPVATLADTVRDQLTTLLGTDNPQVASLSSTLNGVLGVLGLGNLI